MSDIFKIKDAKIGLDWCVLKERLTTIAILTPPYIVVLLYVWITEVSTVIKRDQWHHLTVLTDYFSGTMKASTLFLKHGEHAQLLYNFWFFINGVVFHLNTRLELFLGLAFLGVFIAVLYRRFDESLNGMASPALRSLLFLPLVLIACSFGQHTSFGYSLLSFIVFGGMMLIIIFASIMDRYMVMDSSGFTVIPKLIVIFLVLGVGVAGGGWVVCIGSAIFIYLSWIVTSRPSTKRMLVLGSALLGSAALSLLIMSFISADVPQSSHGFDYIAQNFSQASLYVITLLASSVVDVNRLIKMESLVIIYAAGIAVLAAYILSIYLYYRTKMWVKTYIPILLIAYLWILVLALLLFRFPQFGISNAASPRYVSSLQIGLFGVLWIFIYSSFSTTPGKYGRRTILSILFATVGLLYGAQLLLTIKTVEFVRKYEKASVNTVLTEDFGRKSTVCPHENLCRKGITTLKDNKLNVFMRD